MPVVVAVELLTGLYEAGDVADVVEAEWPPHPARLFCALVAAARGEQDRAALAWLERQPPPVVCAAAQRVSAARSAYVVTNATDQKPGSQFYPGRTNGLRTRARTAPASPTVRFVWEDLDPPAGMVEALDAVARRVPYLGRSTGVALVSAAVLASVPAVDGVTAVFEPCLLDDARVSLRVPYPGYLADLDGLFDAGRPAHEVSRLRGYRHRSTATTGSASGVVEPSAYTDVVVFRLAGLRPDGRLAARFTAALRTAVLGRAGDSAPPALHGHGADGRPHVAFLALPDVGQQHAVGHLLGLAVAVPRLPDDERRAVLAAVLGLRRPGPDGAPAAAVDLRVPGIGEVELAYAPGLVRPWGADPERWRRGSTRWVSATPVVLDRYPKGAGGAEAEVLRSCRMLGLPDPVDVQVSPERLIAGGVRMRPHDLPPKVRGRLFQHVALTFDRPVSGPVLLGAGRYLGVGLLAPVTSAAERAG